MPLVGKKYNKTVIRIAGIDILEFFILPPQVRTHILILC